MNNKDKNSGVSEILYMLLEMLNYHNSILTVNELTDEVRSELVSDNYMAAKILKTLLQENPERSLN